MSIYAPSIDVNSVTVGSTTTDAFWVCECRGKLPGKNVRPYWQTSCPHCRATQEYSPNATLREVIFFKDNYCQDQRQAQLIERVLEKRPMGTATRLMVEVLVEGDKDSASIYGKILACRNLAAPVEIAVPFPFQEDDDKWFQEDDDKWKEDKS